MTPRDGERGTRSDAVRDISVGIVQFHKEYYGRGPTRAKTYWQDDLVVCVMRGGFTKVEASLYAAGRGKDVIAQRSAFQDIMRSRYVSLIEDVTGRHVVGFVSGSQQDPDLIVEVFILAPTDILDEPEHRRSSPAEA